MKLLTLLLLVVLCSAANAQTTLQLGSPIERELQPGQPDGELVLRETRLFHTRKRA